MNRRNFYLTEDHDRMLLEMAGSGDKSSVLRRCIEDGYTVWLAKKALLAKQSTEHASNEVDV